MVANNEWLLARLGQGFFESWYMYWWWDLGKRLVPLSFCIWGLSFQTNLFNCEADPLNSFCEFPLYNIIYYIIIILLTILPNTKACKYLNYFFFFIATLWLPCPESMWSSRNLRRFEFWLCKTCITLAIRRTDWIYSRI